MTILLAYLNVNFNFNIFGYGFMNMHIFYEYIWKSVYSFVLFRTDYTIYTQPIFDRVRVRV